MSWQACAWADALDYDTVSAIAFRVLIKLANVSNDTGTIAFRSKVEMAKELGVSQRTIRRGLKELEYSALIKPGEQDYVKHIRADRRPTVYVLNFTFKSQVADPELEWESDDSPRGDTVIHSPSRGDRSVHHGVTTVVQHRTINKRTSESPLRALTLVDARECDGRPHAVRADGHCVQCWQFIGIPEVVPMPRAGRSR